MPDYIVSSAYVNLNDEKMSKSKGNFITVNEILDIFPKDTVRFYFSFKGPETNDMSCSLDDILITHNKFLVGMLGNFVNRNLSFIQKKFSGLITEAKIDENIIKETIESYKTIGSLYEKAEIRNAVTKTFEYISMANKYYDSMEPWVKVKDNIDEFNSITYTCLYMIANMANLIAPVLTDTSKSIRKLLNLDEFKWEEAKIQGDYQIQDLKILFNRLEEKDLLK